jgi:predicted DNA-binding transcriptional regulator AlpA
VPTEELIDTVEVARMIGLSQRNSVSNYLKKYTDMPRPVIDLGPNRARLWLRPEVEAWLIRRGPVRRGRPSRSSSTSSENFHPPSEGVEVARGGRKPHAAATRRAVSSLKANTE